ncbi:SulP family inorganic anion transporter [Paroceanicella profunda]|uniref:SulP family inorganic anion transporter n=2 Tax=Paroceanicella profunda TaxID=2579971 RepID=A0A5B8FIF5_9RHOB|nr:SulP family inorganic anion transporter [Paroceanicella profunda]
MRGMTRTTLRADAIAGFTGAAVVLPQGVAFATIAGLPPEFGIYTAIVAGLVAALFGSSMVMVSGPTTALSVIIYTTLSPLAEPGSPSYIELMLQLTVMVGVIQLAAGFARMGSVVSFVSHSVMTGFTAAAAILIVVSQLPTALGVQIPGGGTVFERLERVAFALPETNLTALLLSGVTLAAVVLLQRFSRVLPGFLLALVLGSLLGWVLQADLLGVRMVGALPGALPDLRVPDFNTSDTPDLAKGAFAIALIGLLEAVSIGRAMAIRRRERFNATQEIFGQAASNIVGGFFQNYASSGSFTRTGVNVEMGARTPLATVFASLFLALMMLLVLPLIAHIPRPAMAGLILYVAYRLIDQREIRHVIRSSRGESAVLGVTFLSGLLIELDFAIYVGVIASLLLFLHKSSQPAVMVGAPKLVNGARKFVGAKDANLSECPQITIIRIDGLIYFGSVEHIEREFRKVEREHPQQRIKVLILKSVGDIDLAGADLLIEEIRTARRKGGDFHLIAQTTNMLGRLRRLQVIEELGHEKLHANKGEAIAAAVADADNEICRGCRIRLFHECATKPGAHAAMRELGY